jgi:CheY-like chemotaxis protein
MVGLALKDQGIDVVAVGNGEAAVRKISDVKPDLVLADVFMPVRNGYEVCKYVKDDSALAHIPVILLVGAFDPLDEQEAQRVGADGVLKKPFVPPDPLISMVKSALARAGVSYSSSGSDKAAHAQESKPFEVPAMPAPTLPTLAAIPASSGPEISISDTESFVDDAPARPEPVKIDSSSQPLAFGSMLESPTQEEDDATFTSPALPDRNWGAAKDEEETDEEDETEKTGSWRRDAADDSFAARGNARGDWRETTFADSSARRGGHDGWQPTKEKSGFLEAAETEDQIAAVATETRTPPAPSVVEPATPFNGDAWTKAISAGTDAPAPAVSTVIEAKETPVIEAAAPAAVAPVVAEVPTPAAIEAPAPTVIEEKPRVVEAATPVAAAPLASAAPAVVETPAAEKAPENSWFSTASSPWDTVAKKASQLASTWDTPVATPPAAEKPAAVAVEAPSPAVVEEKETPVMGATAPAATLPSTEASHIAEHVKDEVPLPPAAVEAIREEVTHYSGENIVAKETESATKTAKDAAPPKTESSDDLVAKVLAKMSPEMLQAVTREILKPVVEAMVKEELDSKKK